jgi:hypothetical protein
MSNNTYLTNFTKCEHAYSNGRGIIITDIHDHPENQTLQIKCNKCETMAFVDINFRGNKYELSFVKVSTGMYDDFYQMEGFLYKLVTTLVNKKLKWKVEIISNPMWSYVEQIPNFRPHMKQHFNYALGIQKDNMIVYAMKDFFVELYCIYNYFGVPLDITNIIAGLCYEMRKDVDCRDLKCGNECKYNWIEFLEYVNNFNIMRLMAGMGSLRYST